MKANPHPNLCKKLELLLVVSAFVAGGCARPIATSPKQAFREVSSLELEISDDMDFSGLQTAIAQQSKVLQKTGSSTMQLGDTQISRKEYAQALAKLSEVLASSSAVETKAYIRQNFRFFEFYGGKRWGEVLLTGYFEPIIEGSLTRTSKFSQPLYARPDDLVVVDLRAFSERFKEEASLRGRLNKGRVAPYFSRKEIDQDLALKGRGLELCWVDPVDAFFLHIQGSGTVKLPQGREIHVTYAEKNGLKYEPIGKYLKDQVAPLPITMQRIEAIVHRMSPAERGALFAKNPSYVFFTISKERALTSLGIPATPGRTIAVDQRVAPKGALALITFKKPDVSDPALSIEGAPKTEKVSRFVLDQDSGGAITGTDHIDLFWGRGDEAKKVAGILQERATVFYLVPKR